MRKFNLPIFALLVSVVMISCDDDDSVNVHDPDTAPKVSIDRFSNAAGNLFKRENMSTLPAANAPINFDQPPFITAGLGPDGEMVEYYNFDVQPVALVPIYVLFREGESDPVAGQINIIDVIPGESGYNDFWRVNKVTVPANYIANEVASLQEIIERGYPMEATSSIVNCPVVPDGSTASKRFGSAAPTLHRGWYREQVVYYFTFDEKMLTASGNNVPTSPIYVTFNGNGDPATGFKMEMDSEQTHNVVATLPEDASYSPLWVVNVYDNTDFDDVMDLSTAQSANILDDAAAIVNCPVVSVN